MVKILNKLSEKRHFIVSKNNIINSKLPNESDEKLNSIKKSNIFLIKDCINPQGIVNIDQLGGVNFSENAEKLWISVKNAVWYPSSPPSEGSSPLSYIWSINSGETYVPKDSLRKFLFFSSWI